MRFNEKAIEAIKKRKKGNYKRSAKKSRKARKQQIFIESQNGNNLVTIEESAKSSGVDLQG